MKTIKFLFVSLAVILFYGFSNQVMAVNWTKKTNPFPGEGRENSVSFVIKDKAYIGTGYIYKNANIFYKDFWEYDSTTDSWTQIADFPGDARYTAVAFSANGKGYVGLGRGENSILKDFYEYDPSEDAWTQIADFPDARYASVAFSVNNTGYVGTGYDGSKLKNDFYKYENGAWTAINSLPSSDARMSATAFVVGNSAYVAGGGYEPGVFGAFDTMYKYDLQTNSWSKDKYSSVLSSNVLLSYVSSEIPYISVYNDLYRYSFEDSFFEPLGDAFHLGNYFSRESFFVINNVPYMTLGSSGSFDPDLNVDLWYDADATIETDVKPIIVRDLSFVYPNPSSDYFSVQIKEDGIIELYTISGLLVKKQKINAQNNIVDISSLSNGIYTLIIKSGEKNYTAKLIKK
jgi:N-acetylneuraminic acid mutarotase